MASPPLVSSCLLLLLHGGGIIFGGRALAFSSSSPHTHNSLFHLGRPTSVVSTPLLNKKSTEHILRTTLYSSSTDNGTDKQIFHDANVAGVSVSPLGFLAVLQSTIENSSNQKSKVAFPVLLTTPPDSSYTESASTTNTTSIIAAKNIKLPQLFEENFDQTSVTSPEALTFLQLLNGVDMATPILPPDTLSLICVWYAFLLEEMEQVDNYVEDELGLSVGDKVDEADEDDGSDKFRAALDYIKGMVRTRLPPSIPYMDASPWQRARVQLPRAWLHRVRLQELDLQCESKDSEDISSDDSTIRRIPIEFVLECSVDDGTKILEIPLLAMPSSYREELPTQLQRQLDTSNDILQELSLNFNSETSASFVSMALFHRYGKSGAGSADSPTLTMSDGLLNQLGDLQKKGEHEERTARYCWVVPTDDGANNDIDAVIQSNGLPLYRTLSQVKEEDQRVLQHLQQQNFGNNPTGGGEGGDATITTSSDKPQQPKTSPLTLEQQALQQKLRSAWKIAMQKEDTGALEKIQKAMEDLEREVTKNNPNNDEESSLSKIQRAMQQGDTIISPEEAGEAAVGLISELEESVDSGVEESAADDAEK